MLGLLAKLWRLLLIPLVALAFFLGAYLFFYRGGYDPPPRVEVPFAQIPERSSSLGDFAESPTVQGGLLVIDDVHLNAFTPEEIGTLLSRVADRGVAIDFIGESSRASGFLSQSDRRLLLEEKLRQADGFVVILPERSYPEEEVDIVERFVKKGGKLLLIADPTREHDINSLAKRFGISFQQDYLYNPVDYDLNFQDIFVSNFRADAITRDLSRVAFYTASSIRSNGPNLAFTDGHTRSSLTQRPESFSPIVKGRDGHVVAISDLTFMAPPHNSVLDNDRLIANVADFLTASDRSFDLADFPHFFKSDVDILLGSSSLFEDATRVKNLLQAFQIGAEIKGVEDLSGDTVYVGLYEDSADVVQYLDVAGIQVDGAVRTPFTSDIAADQSAIVLLHRVRDRHVLVVLGHSRSALTDIIGRLSSGSFRDGLLGDLVGVYNSS